jgi:hypothetical protein
MSTDNLESKTPESLAADEQEDVKTKHPSDPTPRGNQEREPGETEKSEEKLDRVLGW